MNFYDLDEITSIPAFRDCHDIMLLAISQNEEYIQRASPRLRSDKEFSLLAINSVPMSLVYFSPEIRDDEEIAEIALNKTASSFKFISDRLKKDVLFLEKIILSNYLVFSELDEDLKSNKLLLTSLETALKNSGNLDIEYYEDYLYVLETLREYDILKSINDKSTIKKGVKKFWKTYY